ncbi:homeobox protein NANOG isoform X1 [Meriones unguiculatus]|uniref:homeobox protein NANOG isoform X1 n=1 Tax=Meriones unguiculatus TaxID=10047 RepID=UPI000B4F53CE|nr:homeobox protein NANOG isoform X1 [Meriones unguiculatus]
MSVDTPGPYSVPCSEKASDTEDSLPKPAVHGPEENYSCLQMSAAEKLRTETASPRPSSVDLPVQDSPDSSTSPKVKLSGSQSEEDPDKKGEGKVYAKKQKMRTVFSQAQLCALRDRFQKQKYLSLQQMQELSAILNLSYKQVKTWFQNQRMKCKRWQKNQWLKPSNSATQKGSALAEYPKVYSSYPQGYLVNPSGSLPMWSSQTWTDPTWSNQTWTGSAWSNQTWTAQTWCTQAWNSQTWNTAPFHNLGEDSLQPYTQLPQNFSASDLEVNLEAIGESHAYCSTPQALELFMNYSVNSSGEM